MALKELSLLSKFQGAMVGAVIGDCIGAFFEGRAVAPAEYVIEFICDKIEIQRERPAEFTDDTAMARSVAASLIEHKQLNIKDMAERFTSEFNLEPNRGYGGSVGTVFSTLKEENFANPHGPASRQFNGSGSYGNGGSMRIAPAALFGYNMTQGELDSITRDITKITHSHCDAISGTILQCEAVLQALKEVSTELDQLTFLRSLQGKMAEIEGSNYQETLSRDSDSVKSISPYCKKLYQLCGYIRSGRDPTLAEFEEKIGTGIAASEAVPAAIYSFVRCSKPVEFIPERNPFERTIIHSISLGGDTDTIATMSGAIAGAYYGIEMIPSKWQRSCEGVSDAMDYADKLHNLIKMNNIT